MKVKNPHFNLISIKLFILLSVLIFAPDIACASVTLRVMPLGNSITRGYWGGADATGYRRRLYLLLTGAGYNVDFVGSLEDGIPVDFDKDHEGHDGWTADAIRDNVYNWLVDNPADVVLLHIGTNDVSFGNEDANEVKAILDQIDSFSEEITVILARIVLRLDDLNPETIAYNDAVETMALARIAAGDRIILVDMQNALIYPDDMADVVHPNQTGYNKMGDVWFPFFSSIENYVGVDAANPWISENSSVAGEFVISRTSSSGDLTVYYEFDGTAVYGASGDFNAVPDTNFITIPDGQKSASIAITALDDNDYEADKTIVMNLLNGADYYVAAPSSIKMFLLDDDPEGNIYPPPDWCVDCMDLLAMAYFWLAEGEFLFGDIYEDGIVNFKDFAVLAEDWLFCEPLRVAVTKPYDGEYIPTSTKAIEITADAYSSENPVARIEFYADYKLLGEDSDGSDGWSYLWINFARDREYKLVTLGYDTAGLMQVSAEILIYVAP